MKVKTAFDKTDGKHRLSIWYLSLFVLTALTGGLSFVEIPERVSIAIFVVFLSLAIFIGVQIERTRRRRRTYREAAAPDQNAQLPDEHSKDSP